VPSPAKEIARAPGVQEVTIKVNLTRIFDKLGAKNRTQAATIVIETRLLD
jgi:DNA-binding NarL/FixJ family response regulator